MLTIAPKETSILLVTVVHLAILLHKASPELEVEIRREMNTTTANIKPQIPLQGILKAQTMMIWVEEEVKTLFLENHHHKWALNPNQYRSPRVLSLKIFELRFKMERKLTSKTLKTMSLNAQWTNMDQDSFSKSMMSRLLKRRILFSPRFCLKPTCS